MKLSLLFSDKPFQEYISHHATGTAAAVRFDGGQWRMNNTVVAAQAVNLFRCKRMIGLGTHHQQSFALYTRHLQHIPGKLVHLVKRNGDQLLARLINRIT